MVAQCVSLSHHCGVTSGYCDVPCSHCHGVLLVAPSEDQHCVQSSRVFGELGSRGSELCCTSDTALLCERRQAHHLGKPVL